MVEKFNIQLIVAINVETIFHSIQFFLIWKIFSISLLLLESMKILLLSFVSLKKGRSVIILGEIIMGMFRGNPGARRIITLTILDSMSRLWSRLLLPRTGVHRNISMELPSLLRLSKLLTATIAAASYNSLKAFGLVSDVNNAVDGLLTM